MNTAVIEAVSSIDRDWFEQHPGARCYVRPFIPGEVPPDMPVEASHTLVIQMFVGARMRLPITLYRDDDQPLTEIRTVLTGERWLVAESGHVLPAKGTRRPIWEALTSGESRELLESGFKVKQEAGDDDHPYSG